MKDIKNKLITIEESFQKFQDLKKKGLTIVLSHGTFDLIHPGHILHFEQASKLGDILVVSFTHKDWVNKGPKRPYFSDELRAKAISALEVVDYVLIVPDTTAIKAIEAVKPDIYCKGEEYSNIENDLTKNIEYEVECVKKHGGKVRYIGNTIGSSTKLINNVFNNISNKVKLYIEDLKKNYNIKDFVKNIEDFSKLKVLVIGDVILDEFVYVNIQGLTTKNPVLAGRYINQEIQAGGALAIFRHIKEFCPNVKIVSLLGTESWTDNLMSNYVNNNEDLMIRDINFQTIIKRRYVEASSKSKELRKLFALNKMSDNDISSSTEDLLINNISKYINEYDLVVVSDFGHGILSKKIRNYIEENAKFLALNCQTNSNNYGFNIINKKYNRANIFTLDNQEMILACGNKNMEGSIELNNLRKFLNADYGWLTRGAKETIGVSQNETIYCPSLEDNLVDAIGAGDAFFSLVSLASKINLPIKLTTFIGQLAGSQAISIVGNATPISKQKLLKSGVSLLNF